MQDSENNSTSDTETDAKLALTTEDAIKDATEQLVKLLHDRVVEPVRVFLNKYDAETQRKIIAGDTKQGSVFLEDPIYTCIRGKNANPESFVTDGDMDYCHKKLTYSLGNDKESQMLKALLSPFLHKDKELLDVLFTERTNGDTILAIFSTTNHIFNLRCFLQISNFIQSSESANRILSLIDNDDNRNVLHSWAVGTRSQCSHKVFKYLMEKLSTPTHRAKLLLDTDASGRNVLQILFACCINYDKGIGGIMECLTPDQRKKAILNKDNNGCNVLHGCDYDTVTKILNYLPEADRIPTLKQAFEGDKLSKYADKYIQEHSSQSNPQACSTTAASVSKGSIVPKVITGALTTVGAALLIPGIVLLKHPEVISPKVCYALIAIGITLIAASIILGVVLCAKSKPSSELGVDEAEKVAGDTTGQHLNN